MPNLLQYCQGLETAVQIILTTLKSVSKESTLLLAFANATIFLDALGHVVIAWMWLKQAVAANTGVADCTASDTVFYQGKLASCQFFYRYELPKAICQFELVSKVDDTCHNLKPEQFTGI